MGGNKAPPSTPPLKGRARRFLSDGDEVAVWDLFVRFFHWSLVAGMIVQFLDDSGETLHQYIGYFLAFLVILRVIWGLVAPNYARFSTFVPRPSVAIDYLTDILKGHPKRYIGHNPAGGAMVVLLLISIFITAISGWMMTTDRFWGVEWVEEWHEFSANSILFLVGAHVAGILIASLQHRENLPWSMITGRKKR